MASLTYLFVNAMHAPCYSSWIAETEELDCGDSGCLFELDDDPTGTPTQSRLQSHPLFFSIMYLITLSGVFSRRAR